MEILGKNRMNYRKVVVFIILSLFLFSFFLVRADSSFARTTETLPAEVPVALSNGDVIRQPIPKGITDISSICIQFATYERINRGTVVVTLFEDENVIAQWDHDTSELQDNEYCCFELDSIYHLSDGHDYYFCVEDQYEGDNGIAVWATGTYEVVDSICYRLVCPNIQMRTIVTIAALLIYVALCATVLMNVDERVIMTILMAVLFIAFMIVCPLGSAPDEKKHFLRAYEIAHGNLISMHFGINNAGNILPAALADYSNTNAVLDWNNTTEFYFPTMSLYAPVSYIPQVLGIAVAELLTGRVFLIFLGGRIAGALFCFALSVTSIWLIPYGRKIIFLVLLFPLTIQEMVSLAPDGFTIGLSVFLFSYILYICNREGLIRKRDITVITATCLLLSLCKIVYVVLVLLILLIPKSKFSQKKAMIAFSAGIIASAVLLNLIWLKISSGYLIEFQPGVDTASQVSGIIRDPLNYYIVVVRTLLESGEYYVATMIGYSMGALSVGVTPLVWLSYLTMFVSVLVGNNERLHSIRKQDKYILYLIFAICSLLIITSIYVQWTRLGNGTVIGVQGRYFTPLIPMLTFGILYSRYERDQAANDYSDHTQGSYYYILLFLFNGITLLDMIKFYINNGL